jgi:hypothetical protein
LSLRLSARLGSIYLPRSFSGVVELLKDGELICRRLKKQLRLPNLMSAAA